MWFSIKNVALGRISLEYGGSEVQGSKVQGAEVQGSEVEMFPPFERAYKQLTLNAEPGTFEPSSHLCTEHRFHVNQYIERMIISKGGY